MRPTHNMTAPKSVKRESEKLKKREIRSFSIWHFPAPQTHSQQNTSQRIQFKKSEKNTFHTEPPEMSKRRNTIFFRITCVDKLSKQEAEITYFVPSLPHDLFLSPLVASFPSPRFDFLSTAAVGRVAEAMYEKRKKKRGKRRGKRSEREEERERGIRRDKGRKGVKTKEIRKRTRGSILSRNIGREGVKAREWRKKRKGSRMRQ